MQRHINLFSFQVILKNNGHFIYSRDNKYTHMLIIHIL